MKNRSFVVDQPSVSTERLVQALAEENFHVHKKDEKWFRLLEKLPRGLRNALLAELNLGNYVTSLQYSNWPQKDSIIVSLGLPFKLDFTDNAFGVKKRVLNDAHYWNEDIYQTVDGVDYLIIC